MCGRNPLPLAQLLLLFFVGAFVLNRIVMHLDMQSVSCRPQKRPRKRNQLRRKSQSLSQRCYRQDSVSSKGEQGKQVCVLFLKHSTKKRLILIPKGCELVNLPKVPEKEEKKEATKEAESKA